MNFISVLTPVVALGASLLVPFSAHASGEDPIVRQKLAAEKGCLRQSTGVRRADCLEALADWWWSESVNYNLGSYDPIVEIHRILGVATTHDRNDLDLYTNFLWMQFSTDVNAVQDGLATDVTTKVIDSITEYRQKWHEQNFVFFWITVDEALRFTLPNGVGSKEMKLRYIAFATELQARAKELYPAFRARLPADEQTRIDFQMGVIDRVIVRRKGQVEAL